MNEKRKSLSVALFADVEQADQTVKVSLEHDPIVEVYRGSDGKLFVRLLDSGEVRDESMRLDDFANVFALAEEAAKELPPQLPKDRMYQQKKSVSVAFSGQVDYDRLIVELQLEHNPIAELFRGSDDNFYIRVLKSGAARDESMTLADFAKGFAVAQQAATEIPAEFPGE